MIRGMRKNACPVQLLYYIIELTIHCRGGSDIVGGIICNRLSTVA